VASAVANTPAVALASPGDSGKGSSSDSASAKHASSATNDTPHRQRGPKNPPGEKAASSSSNAATANPSTERPGSRARHTFSPGSDFRPATTGRHPTLVDAPTIQARIGPRPTRASVTPSQVTTSAADPDFITSTHDFGLFSVTSAADPDDNHFVAFVFSSLIFTNILTSGTDPEDNLGFGPASTGVAGQTVNTFMSPFLTFSVAIPIEDPFAELFTQLVALGF
jgi:hypothetical protein